jgi:hypothetical protein
MLRRAISYILVPAILFQGMCVVYADAPCSHDPNGHDRSRHIHLGLKHHDGDENASDSADDHDDDDAIYVPDLVMLSKPLQSAVDGMLISVAVHDVPGVNIPVLVSSHLLTHSPPPSACPIYLQILAILI